MSLREAAQQALEALEGLADYRYTDRVKNTMASLRQALAEPEQTQRWAVFCAGCRKEWSVPYQHPGKSVCADCEARLKAEPEQEPVAYCTYPKCQTTAAGCSGVCRQPAPTPRKPLSDEQIALIVGECAASAYQHDDFSFARAIERAHGIGEQT